MLLNRYFVRSLLCLALMSAISHSAASASRSPLPCLDSEILEVDRSYTVELSDSSTETNLVGVSVPRAGWIAVEVERADSREVGAWWDLWPTPCGSPASFVEHGFDSGLLRVSEPGTVHLRLGQVDHAGGGSLNLVTRYLDAIPVSWRGAGRSGGGNPRSTLVQKEGESGDDTESEETETFPIRSNGCSSLGAFVQKEGESGDDTESEETETFPIRTGCGCRAQGADDLMRCATPIRLGEQLRGQLESPWADDRDYFVFVLEEAGKIRISTSGSVDTFGSLYDATGRHLLSADGGGEGENFTFEATLATGRYFARVEGLSGSEGDYLLRIE